MRWQDQGPSNWSRHVRPRVGSIYGDCKQVEVTREILEMAIRALEGTTGMCILAADWNVEPAQVKAWLGQINPNWEVIAPPQDTCFTAAGSSKIDCFVGTRVAAGLTGEVNVHQTALCTHKVVTMTIKVAGEEWA